MLHDETDNITDAAREQRAEERFESGEVYIEPDGPDPEAESDVWNEWRREDYLELVDAPTPVLGLPRPVGTPIRRAFGRVPRRAAVKSAAAAGDSDSEPDIGPPSLQVSGGVPHVG